MMRTPRAALVAMLIPLLAPLAACAADAPRPAPRAVQAVTEVDRTRGREEIVEIAPPPQVPVALPAASPPPPPIPSPEQQPAATPASPPPAGGSSLTVGEVTGVVTQHQADIKRWCWPRAVGATTTANIELRITVDPSGEVQSSRATGSDTAVAQCIESQARTWRFPGGSSRPIVIPFHLVRD
jgi:hypothetical protein